MTVIGPVKKNKMVTTCKPSFSFFLAEYCDTLWRHFCFPRIPYIFQQGYYKESSQDDAQDDQGAQMDMVVINWVFFRFCLQF
jgi:hypothetical protein